ncbi:LacI family DNA-binding transcriptional regulator [Bifidobacterium samirii]|uniref:Transcriptional regulator n=1 Tax=Bifidobacterium samirii TaxID=2306974 RepID=A0A430FVJ0_9BIFI|nr:LacI family DNA-binding transcriptional regulator [Bifidobacterium samirii]RSX57789.1 transcriptional regulator [Bifidobacterium samirii]
MAKVTIADIAREAQVSVTTVSRFINGNYGKMSDATRTRIQETVDRLQYRPSASAQRMRQQDTHVIGVVVADISNVFSSLMFKGIYTKLQPIGYDVMLMNANNSLQEEHDAIDRLLSQQVDGLIVQPSARLFSAYESIIDARKPLVLIDREPDDRPDDIAQVTADNTDSCRLLARHLADKGYGNIIALTRVRSEISAQNKRVEGLLSGAEDSNALLLHFEAGEEDVDWLARKIAVTLDHVHGRTAIVSLMGPLLFDTLAALRRLHITFPKDVGLVSFDDWQWSQYVQDGIHLLQQDPQKLGQAAAHNLLEQIRSRAGGNDPYAASRIVTLPVEVVEAPSI